ncbi:metal-dependent transcriptional regulator [bacterium]|nr:metal-dependent transcriptional regulator [bacterium]
MLSDTVGLYLITVFRITQDEPWAKTGRIASALDVGMSSVSEMLKQLDEAGYIVHRSRMGAQLTETGHRLALNRLRKHRILETFLVELVGYSIDEVHDEAGCLEHAISDRLIDRLEKLLGYPRFDPHGHPILDSNGTMERIPSHSLCQMTVGATAT